MNTPLKKSIALHIAAFLLCVIDLPLFWNNRTTPGQVPIIVDLKDVKISEMTNLPPKAKFGDEDREASMVKRKIEKKYTKEEPKEEPKPEPEPEKQVQKKEPEAEPAAEPKPIKNDFLEAPKPAAKPNIKPQPRKPKAAPQPKKPEPKKKAEPKKDTSKPELANPLKSLLASVDALEKEGNADTTATIKEGTDVNNTGIEGGIGGSYFSELSISEIDAIAGRLRACWNLDPGAMGIEDMVVEIRAQLNQDGSVRRVDIADTSRYNSDSHFRSVADSARRAVYICAPYQILADKYAEKYDMWKVMRLRFNPLDSSVR
ncbi:MAG: hypothetical protein IJ482_07400 [Alphaproteobacteria bacterium]|nr:hypothetical protein [Alphaproteobacteria bacterium]